MRPPRWFRPARDLRSVLARLNAQNPAAVRSLEKKIAAGMRSRRVGKHAKGDDLRFRQGVRALLKTRLLRRVGHQHIGRFVICFELSDLAARRHITEDQAIGAWGEVWTCLKMWRPDIPDRIRQCVWCGRLFWSLRPIDRFCSVACERSPQLLDGAEDALARYLEAELDRIKAIATASKMKFAELDGVLRTLHTDYRKRLLMFMFRPLGDPPHVPDEIANPHAFLVVWAFVFKGHPAIAARAFQCPRCERVRWKDPRAKYCSATCRRAAWKKKRRRSPSSSTPSNPT
jgi:hypothetical protein